MQRLTSGGGEVGLGGSSGGGVDPMTMGASAATQLLLGVLNAESQNAQAKGQAELDAAKGLWSGFNKEWAPRSVAQYADPGMYALAGALKGVGDDASLRSVEGMSKWFKSLGEKPGAEGTSSKVGAPVQEMAPAAIPQPVAPQTMPAEGPKSFEDFLQSLPPGSGKMLPATRGSKWYTA